ncbi:DUF6771 family protein [Erythrobacter sp. 3-20A1M]|uniref:DUF6771 family protein n=1 Tax=Erythrobacter sp. 3-20A1M TaxID=2653850 RepID=UPI003530290B
MPSDNRSRILIAIERAPEWVRRDLTAKDQGVRDRAEEALAAMIASALEQVGSA